MYILELFIGSIVLFQLIFYFIYNIFNEKISISVPKQTIRDKLRTIHIKHHKIYQLHKYCVANGVMPINAYLSNSQVLNTMFNESAKGNYELNICGFFR